MGEPADRARNREQHREHVDGESESLVDETRVEVDIGVQLALHEVVVFQRDFLQLECDVEQGVLAGDFEDVVGGLLDDARTRVEILVHAMAETHESSRAVLHALDERRNIVDAADLGQHAHDGLVGATMKRSVQR
jgi:hypothetical protein